MSNLAVCGLWKEGQVTVQRLLVNELNMISDLSQNPWWLPTPLSFWLYFNGPKYAAFSLCTCWIPRWVNHMTSCFQFRGVLHVFLLFFNISKQFLPLQPITSSYFFVIWMIHKDYYFQCRVHKKLVHVSHWQSYKSQSHCFKITHARTKLGGLFFHL